MSDDLIVPAAEANRSFSKLLRAAREGKRITITSHGEPVAELIPAGEEARRAAKRAAALAELKAHWATLEPKVVGPWTREELYERD
ncbi:MAG TPA: type II toxin-antitoxin system prevent-host-death family antitoxin [Caulobacteraceae bacterium]|jgi:prevent-host-death family protein